ncbi:tetratricopeptide repeat-containing protein [Rhizobium mayense]|uniref:Tetratricopeptide repeat-containing protein n=1 Tax=Rhizobium mayense TaxID=1312184 RepID=A0ABT7K412_9HYPH|nr:tetratricopeptide repeat-containing protein [Rhizobium mayense]MDL2403347.1 tetratricopeptide repeat-containing protein [Rhizobium mayense]
MSNNTSRARSVDKLPVIAGKAPVIRALYEAFYNQRDIPSLRAALFERVASNPADAAALMDLSIVLQSLGEAEKAAIHQRAALEASRIFRIRNGRGTGPNILVFVSPGDFMANTPIEFLLESSDANILLYYVDSETRDLADVPEHDVAFVAIAEAPDKRPVLENLDRLLSDWPGPIMNNSPKRIIELTRDGVAEMFRNEPTILAPKTMRVSREQLEKLASGELAISSIGELESLPIIVRPIGTHAGNGLDKISTLPELSIYLTAQSEDQFYIAPFIDYSGPDGRFRKQRIAFVDGRPFASHLAISDHWMVHYLSAGMTEYAERRAEEAEWMANFDTDFARRHARAFDALQCRIGLDYFTIDCGELPDGRLLLFEADVAMVVHSMDSEAIFPYKKQAMRKLFSAFELALQQCVARTKKAQQ